VKLRCQLILIAHLGRGLFDFDDLAGYYQELKEWFGGPERAVPQLMDNASLADDLSDGLEELVRHNIDVERMPLQKV
jgi:hypothetical protein